MFYENARSRGGGYITFVSFFTVVGMVYVLSKGDSTSLITITIVDDEKFRCDTRSVRWIHKWSRNGVEHSLHYDRGEMSTPLTSSSPIH